MKRAVDLCWRMAYRCAYPLAVIWWNMFGCDGIVIAVWVNGKVLAVKHSYKPYLRLPGGGIRRGEDHRLAAVRELHEETGITVPVNDLLLVTKATSSYGELYLYEVLLIDKPLLRVDAREIVSAGFEDPKLVFDKTVEVTRYLNSKKPERHQM